MVFMHGKRTALDYFDNFGIQNHDRVRYPANVDPRVYYWDDNDVRVAVEFARSVGKEAWAVSCGYVEGDFLYIFSFTANSIVKHTFEILWR
jgi:hypothetical protein